MKKTGWVLVGLLFAWSFGGPVFAQETSSPESSDFRFAIMRPDPETLQRWMDEYETAPEAEIDPIIQSYLLQAQEAALPTSLSLLNHIQYTPSQRSQGGCGDCWVWASTGVMEIALSVQNNVLDRLSTQFINSCKTDSYPCCGGSLNGFSSWYASKGYAIPWSNTNASFQDGSKSCSGTPAVACANISTAPKYPLTSISPTTVPTTGYSTDATPITNIKNVLNQEKGIYFAYYLANNTDWNGFFSFWSNQPETAIWDPDQYCGHTWVNGQGAGHAVLIVGYDDSDINSANHYWIVLNSWGTTGGRPNGLFRMKMHMNYNCTLQGISGYVRQFQTLNMGYSIPSAFHPDTIGVYRPSDSTFYLRNTNTSGSPDITARYGISGDLPVVGDWTGSGMKTIGVYRPNKATFYLRNTNSSGIGNITVRYGLTGDIPIAGDWTNKGYDSVGVYRPSNSIFFLRNSNTTGIADIKARYGIPGDLPLVGDWTGKGYDSIGVYRPSNGKFYLRNSNTTGVADLSFSFGPLGGIPLVGDWNGDGIDTVGIYLDGTAYLRNSNTSGPADTTFSYGLLGDVPIAGDWDGLP
jgi:C1A family cysteine protease